MDFSSAQNELQMSLVLKILLLDYPFPAPFPSQKKLVYRNTRSYRHRIAAFGDSSVFTTKSKILGVLCEHVLHLWTAVSRGKKVIIPTFQIV